MPPQRVGGWFEPLPVELAALCTVASLQVGISVINSLVVEAQACSGTLDLSDAVDWRYCRRSEPEL